MTKFKKLMALAAVSMLGIQLMGAGTAFAAGPQSDSDCDFGSDSLDITLGQNELNGGDDKADVSLWIDADGVLQCDTFGTANDGEQAVATIDSITVEMDDDDSDASLTIYLDPDGDGSGGDEDASEWPAFDSFDIDVTTKLYVDGGGVNTGAGVSASNNLSIKFGKDTFSFAGTSGTYSAYALNIEGGDGKDTIDASKATVKVTAAGGAGDDLLKGGSGNDVLGGDADNDVLYGYAGNDTLTGGANSGATGKDACWAGDDNDTTVTCETVAPGAGDDDVNTGATTIVYSDLTGGIEWTNLTILGGTPGDIATGGDAGSDTFASEPSKVVGSAGDDVIVDDNAANLDGGAGDDFVKGSTAAGAALGGAGDDLVVAFDGSVINTLQGNTGNDVLRGKGGDDVLQGGPGKDQAWGGSGSKDYCAAEVTNRCEVGKV